MATRTISNVESDSAAPRQIFKSLPLFPDNVPTAPLLRLAYAKLLERDQSEVDRLIHACEDLGFFYLDLSGPGDGLIADADRLFEVGEELFELPLEEKKKYDFQRKKSYFGYKGLGANALDKNGNVDRHEMYNVSKDDTLRISDQPWPQPHIFDRERQLLRSFITSAHSIVAMVLEILNNHLELPPGTLQSMHRLEGHSGDQVRFIKTPPQRRDEQQLAIGEHTDFGSVTVLFNKLGGLQVLPPGRDAEWCYVKPLTNHAIINLGDAMVKFTNGLLRSNIHRVIPPPGAQADHTRYSLVYFNRPEDEVYLKRLESHVIPPLADSEVEEEVMSKDWIIRRALGNRIELYGKEAGDNDWAKGTENTSRRADL